MFRSSFPYVGRSVMMSRRPSAVGVYPLGTPIVPVCRSCEAWKGFVRSDDDTTLTLVCPRRRCPSVVYTVPVCCSRIGWRGPRCTPLHRCCATPVTAVRQSSHCPQCPPSQRIKSSPVAVRLSFRQRKS